MDAEKEVIRFKMELLRKMPFYGDIVMRLPFIENNNIPTARTNGRTIEYSSAFFSGLTRGQINFVLMHEVFHVLLFHSKRNGDRDPRLWNTAADMVVNKMLVCLTIDMQRREIPFERPENGIFANIELSETVESLYEQLYADNKNNKDHKKIRFRLSNYGNDPVFRETDAPDDIDFPDFDPDEAGMGAVIDVTASSEGLGENILTQLIRESASKNRSAFGSYFIPSQIYSLTESKKIKWQTLLRDLCTEGQSDETSYTTPERKYIHMDLILPGYSQDDNVIEEIWAFVDSSGSIVKNEMEQFLTQLYRIAKEFKCVFNICYWDTEVNYVYRKILKEDDILKSLPRHSGGTDINCVYKWLKDNRVRPDVMLILTDGYFGCLSSSLFIPSLAKKTIMVLSGNIAVSDDMKRIGKITRLE